MRAVGVGGQRRGPLIARGSPSAGVASPAAVRQGGWVARALRTLPQLGRAARLALPRPRARGSRAAAQRPARQRRRRARGRGGRRTSLVSVPAIPHCPFRLEEGDERAIAASDRPHAPQREPAGPEVPRPAAKTGSQLPRRLILGARARSAAPCHRAPPPAVASERPGLAAAAPPRRRRPRGPPRRLPTRSRSRPRAARSRRCTG
jgi:hypothetical protein